MKIAVLSDIHSNFGALQSVLEHMENLPDTDKPEEVWFLGDLWGRGPDALEICEWFEKSASDSSFRWVIGNHDLGVLHSLTPAQLELVKDEEVKKTWERDRNKLGTLPEETRSKQTILLDQPPVQIFETETIKYIFTHHVAADSDFTAAYHFPWKEVLLTRAIQFLVETEKKDRGLVNIYGHTHIANLASATCNGDIHLNVERIIPEQKYPLDPGKVWLINPGSVGSPRDRDSRAGYMVLDPHDRTVIFYRVPYDRKEFFRRMLEGGMTPDLAGKIVNADWPHDVPPDWQEHFRRTRMDK